MKEGILISSPVDISSALRKATEENKNWEYSEICTTLYRHAEIMMDRFYHGIAVPRFPDKLPTPLIAVEPMNIRTLAAYRIVPDDYGLPFKLSFNEAHFIEKDGKKVWEFGDWALRESLTHELAHHWQQLRGRDPFKQTSRVTHNQEFCQKLEELGLHPTPGVGAHYAVADENSPFGILMKELGIKRPQEASERSKKVDWFEIGKKRRGTSTLTKWSCGCQNVRVGTKEFKAHCDKCGNPFVAVGMLGLTEK